MSLPKYWVVKRNDKDPRWRDIINYLNENYIHPSGGHFGGSVNNYYGVDGNNGFNGASCADELDDFENYPTLLTIDEFFRLLNSSENDYEIF